VVTNFETNPAELGFFFFGAKISSPPGKQKKKCLKILQRRFYLKKNGTKSPHTLRRRKTKFARF
jgi:hypothetical protein